MIVPFKLTYFVYDDGDFISFLACFGSIIPAFLFGAALYQGFLKFDLKYLRTAAILLLNTMLNGIIKDVLKGERVASSGRDLCVNEGYGMPSDHAQFMFCWLAIFIYDLGTHRLAKSSVSQKPFFAFMYHNLLYVGSIGLSLFVCYSRYYLGCHSVLQLFIGAIIGLLIGIVTIIVGSKISSKKIKYQ
ncbi:hypothetical protein PCE1_000806 [Barthelona sp. PCE]